MKILITGGSGYIGGCLGEYLRKKGHNILLASRDISNNGSHISSGVDFVQVFWNDQNSLNKVCSDVDVVIHTAGMNKKDCSENPFDALMFNGVATANLVRAAVDNSVPKFIYLSSYHVYSNPLQGEIQESNCLCNYHPYAISHRVGEDAVLAASEQGLIDSIVLRMSNGFGTPFRPEVDCWTLFVNDICRQAVETNELLIRSNGQELRNFIPVKEICNIIDFLIKNQAKENSAIRQNLINIGSDSNMSLLEMAKTIQYRCFKVLGLETEIINDQTKLIKPIPEFSFNLNRLYNLGYKTKFDTESEIDNLLIFCLKNFSRNLREIYE